MVVISKTKKGYKIVSYELSNYNPWRDNETVYFRIVVYKYPYRKEYFIKEEGLRAVRITVKYLKMHFPYVYRVMLAEMEGI